MLPDNSQSEKPRSSLLDGLLEFFGKVPGEKTKRIHIVDKPMKGVVKGALGSTLLVEHGGAEIDIEFQDPETITAEGDAEAKRITAEANKIIADAKRDANRITQET
jgi:hypothetical protein